MLTPEMRTALLPPRAKQDSGFARNARLKSAFSPPLPLWRLRSCSLLHHFFAAFCFLSLSLFGPALASAEISVSLTAKSLAGKGSPSLSVEVLSGRYAGFSLELDRSDGQQLLMDRKGGSAGVKRVFELKQPPGEFQWKGMLYATLNSGERQELPLNFETAVLGPPQLSARDDAVDLEGQKLELWLDRPVARLHLRVSDDRGQVVDEGVRQVAELFDSAQVKDGLWPLKLSWSQPDGSTVLRIDVKAEDRHGFYQELQLYPWQVSIPHETVLFETGKSEIRESETPKLKEALAELKKAIERYGRFAKVQLFIAGHTDTVGDAKSNESLSEARARAIATWFRQAGVKLPLHYTGFGERSLLVQTADQVDEPRNRRAEYIVAVEAPLSAKWKRLP